MKADINVIDFDGLQLRPPHIVNDLPAGGRRLIQEAQGYIATIQSGAVTFENGVHTGALPGGVIRGRQAAPGRR
jgi:N-acyl-D-aspartate/D-glutamate deacylase